MPVQKIKTGKTKTYFDQIKAQLHRIKKGI
jgi:hypothetical protein